jgi:hypothetical protein
MTARVLRVAGSVPTFEQRCWAAMLDAGSGAVLSYTTAAAIYGVPGFERRDVHVSRPRRGAEWDATLATLHEPRFLPDRHTHVLPNGLRVTTLARALFDLASLLHPLRVARAIDNSLNRGLVDLEVLRVVTIEMVARGRKGSALMRKLLTARGAGYIPPASGLEATFLAGWVAAGHPPLRREVDSGGDHWVGRVDLRDEVVPLIVEIDSEIHHTALLDVESDEKRDEELPEAGFEIERVTEYEIRHDLDAAVERVAKRRAELLARRSAPEPA